MRRTTWAVGAVALITALATPPAVADHGHGHGSTPDRIDLPNGWQPEGITTDGKNLYVGSLADGAIWEASAKTGDGRVLAAGAEGRVAVGVDYDKRRDLLWVAGGPTNEVRAQDADTGEVLATYVFPSDTPRFFNDLVVTRDGVYVTDSSNQELAVVPFACGRHGHGGHHGHGKHGHGHHGSGHGHDALPRPSAAYTLPLTGDLVYQDGFNLNGIVEFKHTLVSVQSNTGLLFSIDRRDGDTDLIDVDGDPLVNGDGLELRGHTLFVVKNQDNQVVQLDLDSHADTAEQEAVLTSPDLDVPATVAYARGSLWAANARFTTTPTPDTPYWVTRLSLD